MANREYVCRKARVINVKDYKISYCGDIHVKNIHHIDVEYNGNYYSVIFGEYLNGGFFSIPNWNCGGELANFSDVFWNTESIQRSLKSKKTARVIAQAIADYIKESE